MTRKRCIEENRIVPKRRKTNILKCGGDCGVKECTYEADRKSHLQKHIRAKKGIKAFTCAFCPYKCAQKSHLIGHVRTKHKNECTDDGACENMNIKPKGSLLKKPKRFESIITNHEWQYLKGIVKSCLEKDRRYQYEGRYAKRPDNHTIHRMTGEILDAVMKKKLLTSGIDASGLCGPLILRPHSLFSLSLDRKNNDLAHFLPGEATLKNLEIVSRAMNHRSNVVRRYGDRFPEIVRTKRSEAKSKMEISAALRRESMSAYKTKNGKKRINALYNSCSNIYHNKDAKMYFETSRAFFTYVLKLYEKQQGRCALSNIFMHHRDTAEWASDPFQISIDAIDPTLGHRQGNLRIVCMFLNPTSRDKDKTHVAADDHLYPSNWTLDLFQRVFLIRS